MASHTHRGSVQPNTGDPGYLRILVLINIASQGLQGLLAPLTAELAVDFAFTSSHVAGIQAGFLLVYALATPLWAVAAGRLTRRRLLLAGSVAWSACLFFASLAADPSTFVACFVAAAIGNAAVVPISYSMAVDVVPPERRGRAFGWLLTGQTVSFGMAFLIGGLLGDHEGVLWRLPFQIFAVLGAVSALLLLIVRRYEPVHGAMETALQGFLQDGGQYDLRIRWRDMNSLLRPISNLYLVASGVLFMASTGAVNFWVIAMLRHDHGLDAESATWLTIALFLVQVPGAVIVGRLADRLSLRRRNARLGLLLGFTLLTLPCYFAGFLIPWTDAAVTSPGFVAFLALMFAGGFASCALPPLTFNVVNEINPPEKRGVLFALINVSRLLGRAIGIQTVTIIGGAWYSGALSPGLAWTALFLIPAAGCLVPVLLSVDSDRIALDHHLRDRTRKDVPPAAA